MVRLIVLVMFTNVRQLPKFLDFFQLGRNFNLNNNNLVYGGCACILYKYVLSEIVYTVSIVCELILKLNSQCGTNLNVNKPEVNIELDNITFELPLQRNKSKILEHWSFS